MSATIASSGATGPNVLRSAAPSRPRAIATARKGVYPEGIVEDIAPGRLRQFFVQDHDQFRISNAVREPILFAAHNLLRDPPFSRLDLITCRNLLIYLDRAAQRQVLETFHFALRPGGLLFLGSAETADAAPEHAAEPAPAEPLRPREPAA